MGMTMRREVGNKAMSVSYYWAINAPPSYGNTWQCANYFVPLDDKRAVVE